jgi:hypothetical protein
VDDKLLGANNVDVPQRATAGGRRLLPLSVHTVAGLHRGGHSVPDPARQYGLLDEAFGPFKREIVSCDPDYAAKIGLALSSVQTIAPAYFADREAADPFVWAASNLAEAEQNKINAYTVEWRYAILRMHEVIALAVPHLDEDDLARFHKHFKTVFGDDYATVPHIDLDAAFRPKFEENFCHQLYCAAISFLVHKMPFVQGITSSCEIGGIVSKAINDDISALESGALSKLDHARVDAV